MVSSAHFDCAFYSGRPADMNVHFPHNSAIYLAQKAGKPAALFLENTDALLHTCLYSLWVGSMQALQQG